MDFLKGTVSFLSKSAPAHTPDTHTQLKLENDRRLCCILETPSQQMENAQTRWIFSPRRWAHFWDDELSRPLDSLPHLVRQAEPFPFAAALWTTTSMRHGAKIAISWNDTPTISMLICTNNSAWTLEVWQPMQMSAFMLRRGVAKWRGYEVCAVNYACR